ncbi:MAG: hypothetical protein GC182_21520 [Rhodopseudomonas sp.]|nr:hypothetical protein [Rhodopseudomonas sp.]
MRYSRLPASARYRLCRAFLTGAALTMLAGCGVNGDFGEVNRTLVRDDIHDWIGRNRPADHLDALTEIQPTDDERQLRDLAYPLLEPPYDRNKTTSVLGEYGLKREGLAEAADRTMYYRHLVDHDNRSPASRYAQLVDDIRNDLTRMPPFFEVAARVIDMDAKRHKSLAFVTELSDVERGQANERMKENARVIAMVRTSLVQRAASYRYALERLVLSAPTREVGDADRLMADMQARVAYYRNHTAPQFVSERSLASNR